MSLDMAVSKIPSCLDIQELYSNSKWGLSSKNLSWRTHSVSSCFDFKLSYRLVLLFHLQ